MLFAPTDGGYKTSKVTMALRGHNSSTKMNVTSQKMNRASQKDGRSFSKK